MTQHMTHMHTHAMRVYSLFVEDDTIAALKQHDRRLLIQQMIVMD